MRMRRFLTMAAVVLAVAGGTVAIDGLLQRRGSGDQVVSGPSGTVTPGAGTSTTTGPSTTAGPRPAPGQVTISGRVTVVHLEGAVIDPRTVPTPLTIMSDRGFGNGGEITGVTVDGGAASIVWDGGRPFVLSSGGGLVLDPVRADLTPDGLRLALADSVQRFAPGTYQLDTPVAVGASGVAGARDAVTFVADDAARFSPSGDTALLLGRDAPHHATGPGAVHLEGALELTDATGTRSVRSVDLASGPYDVTVTPAPDGGWTITATLQGETTAT